MNHTSYREGMVHQNAEGLKMGFTERLLEDRRFSLGALQIERNCRVPRIARQPLRPPAPIKSTARRMRSNGSKSTLRGRESRQHAIKVLDLSHTRL
jgi:hypothetical protein